ncbi:hypothetical protein [Streptomyces sp. NPDC057794]|uniref:hypothetical protein n=1 Tax=Streptomyces sp. NPDC057794 TaxID=3346251 RepID=UPI0036B64458
MTAAPMWVLPRSVTVGRLAQASPGVPRPHRAPGPGGRSDQAAHLAGPAAALDAARVLPRPYGLAALAGDDRRTPSTTTPPAVHRQAG